MSKNTATIVIPVQPLLTQAPSLETLPVALPSAAEISEVCQRQILPRLSQADLKAHGLTRQQLVKSIVEIVAVNLASGRGLHVMRYCGDSAANALASYSDRVFTTYLAEHRRIDQLFIYRDEVEWQRLCNRLQAMARHMLQRYDLPTSLAADFAQQTCVSILSHRFPYDVPFDAWSALILKNLIRWTAQRSHETLDQNWIIISLDQLIGSARPDGHELPTMHDLLKDSAADLIFERREIQEVLLEAIGQLPSSEQKWVMIYGFLFELADAEIANRLGKSRQAVYNLRHRALRELRRVLVIID